MKLTLAVRLIVLFWISASLVAFGEPPTKGLKFEGMKGGFNKKSLDGVEVVAVERLVDSPGDQIGISSGVAPFDPYVFHFLAAGSYKRKIDQDWSWELLDAKYYFSVDKGLTKELANKYGVNPRQINRLEYSVSTNFLRSFFYGKGILLKDFIRYYRAQFLVGGGMFKSTQRTQGALNLGLQMNFYISSSTTLNLDIRNAFAFGGGDQSSYPTFAAGIGLNL